MANESELCVDHLLQMVNKIDQLFGEFDENSTSNNAETLAEQSRDLSKEIHSFIENNKTVIPNYILKKVTDSLKKLEARANESGKTKLRFKFNRPAKQSTTEQTSPDAKSRTTKAESESVGNNNCAIGDVVEKNLVGFRDLTGEKNLQLNRDSVDSKDVHLINLRNCSVSIRGSTSTVYIRKCLNCQISIFLATRSVTVTECCDVKLRVICQQLRIDSTTRLQLQLFVSVRSMLESSREVSFEPLENWLSRKPETDKEVSHLVERANFDMSRNNWKCVDDFDWLSPDRPSANYKLLETS